MCVDSHISIFLKHYINLYDKQLSSLLKLIQQIIQLLDYKSTR